MSRRAPRQMPDLVGAVGEVGDLLARPYAAPHPLGSVGEPAHRLGDGVGKRNESTSITEARTTKKRNIAQRSEAMTRSISPPCVESSSAPRRRRPLDRHATETIVSPAALMRRGFASCPAAPRRPRAATCRWSSNRRPRAASGRREGEAGIGPEPSPPRQSAIAVTSASARSPAHERKAIASRAAAGRHGRKCARACGSA